MPSFDVTIEGKTYHVEVPDPGACPLRVIVDGQPFAVAIEGGNASAQPEQLAALAASARPAASAPTPLPGPSPAYISRSPAPPAKGGHGEVRAPMPGTILSINVSAGQAVKAADTVCILEAMKMKNPIRAMGAGTVTEIAVSTGQNVSYHQLLIKIDQGPGL
jgi:glutaconyl-CoA/methylmalonyl-CoA decarboxylase subunit gamma